MCYCLFRAKLKTHRRWRQKQNTDAKYYTGKGIEQGKLEMLFSLVRNHILSSADAAKRVGMPEVDFVSLMQKGTRGQVPLENGQK